MYSSYSSLLAVLNPAYIPAVKKYLKTGTPLKKLIENQVSAWLKVSNPKSLSGQVKEIFWQHYKNWCGTSQNVEHMKTSTNVQ